MSFNSTDWALLAQATAQVAVGGRIGVTLVDGVITGYLDASGNGNWVQVIQVSDATYSGSYLGILMQGQSAADTLRIDDFSGGTLAEQSAQSLGATLVAWLGGLWQGVKGLGADLLALVSPVSSAQAHPAELPARPAALLQASETITTTITYTYDPLYRLAGADYSDGSYFHYTYDGVGNRLTQETGTITNTYAYTSNKLSSIISGSGSIDFTWDDNGNLLDDGSYTYSYDHANRLKNVNGPEVSASYAYNGLGVRVQETAGGTTTHYVVDLAAGLTQVLSDGTNTYLYGVGRIAQESTSGEAYFLADALGSVRQLVDANGSVQMVKNYEPYGEVLTSVGNGMSNYGFTGEWTSSFNELVYLRTRWYAPELGVFLSSDLWPGNPRRPLTFNKWIYVEADPINAVDPIGLRRIKIWAAAFIKDAILAFPHFYEPKYWDSTYQEYVMNIPALTLSASALWNGNGRDFYSGGGRASSKVWHDVVIDTDPYAPSSVVSNEADTGRTQVFFTCPLCIPNYSANGFGYATAKAPKPPIETINRSPDRCKITVDIDIYNAPNSGSNPLGPEAPPIILGNWNLAVWQATPPIRYHYKIVFDLRNRTVEYEGKHSAFPWHELFIEGLLPAHRFPPSGPFHTPIDLYPEVGGDPSFGPFFQALQLDDKENSSICSFCK